MPTIEEQLRFFAVKVNNGSGCLFQPDTLDYSYVLTVKHNLKKADNSICLSNEITVLTSNLDGEPLRIIAVIIDENLDLALLVIEFIGDSDYPLSFSKPKREEKVVVYGYPNYRFNEAIKTTSLPCISDFEHQNNISFELISEKPMFSFNRGAQQNVIGFSGSGIFRIESNRLILKGIFLSLDNTEGAHNKLNGYYIDCFNYMLNNSTYLELMPSYLTSFKEHKINVFNSINQLIRNGLSPNLANILDSGITPNSIAEQFKGNLYAPYSENYRDKLLNQKMWKAWVELLICLDISSENPNYTLTTFLRNIKLYHSINNNINIVDEFVRVFLLDKTLMESISPNDIIAFSSEIEPSKKSLKKELIAKIVTNIYKSKASDSSVWIDDPNRVKPFSCIHINHFAEKIGEIDTELSLDEIKRIIKSEIINILNYGNT